MRSSADMKEFTENYLFRKLQKSRSKTFSTLGLVSPVEAPVKLGVTSRRDIKLPEMRLRNARNMFTNKFGYGNYSYNRTGIEG